MNRQLTVEIFRIEIDQHVVYGERERDFHEAHTALFSHTPSIRTPISQNR